MERSASSARMAEIPSPLSSASRASFALRRLELAVLTASWAASYSFFTSSEGLVLALYASDAAWNLANALS